MPTLRVFAFALWFALLAAVPNRAAAGNILFVSDTTGSTNIVGVLMLEGHTVMMVTNDFATGNMALQGSLSGYDAIFWIAEGSGSGSAHTNAAVFTNLTNYVMAGGRVFVAGYDTVASPSDPMLLAFVGGTGSTDVPGAPGPVSMASNSLTTGVVDIRGVTPSGFYSDRDTVTGLTATTTAVVSTASGRGAGEAQWTLRTLGAGEVAYVSNGQPRGIHASWTTTTMGGAGAYNAAVRNFASVVLGGAPIIRFMGPSMEDEGTDVVITASVMDPEMDPFTFSWDLDGDGTYGENSGMTSYTIPGTMTDGDERIDLSIEASDGTETRTADFSVMINNVAPTITSTPMDTTAFIGSEWSYQLAWDDPADLRDLPAFSMLAGPMGMVVSRGGLITFTPTAADRDMTFMCEVQVDDGDGGIVTQMFDLMVSNNRPPNEPLMPFSPINRDRITETMPTLVVANGSDPDGDRLSYFFQIDQVSSFDSPFLLMSPEIVEMGGGRTSWTVPSNLTPGVWFWQVRATDGTAMTAWANAVFVIGDDSTTDAGTGGGDGGATGDAGPGITPPPPLPRDRGGCCMVAGSQQDSPAAPLLAAGLLLLALLRRRRR